MEKSNMPVLPKALLSALTVIQLIDIAIHAATNQIELLRVSSNAVIFILVILVVIGRQLAMKTPVYFGAVALYAALNGVFLALYGLTNPEQGDAPRTMLFILVLVTVLLPIPLFKKLKS